MVMGLVITFFESVVKGLVMFAISLWVFGAVKNLVVCENLSSLLKKQLDVIHCGPK